MWQKILERLLKGKPELSARKFVEVEVPRLGVSGANVIVLTDSKDFYVLKWADPRSEHPIMVQVQKREEVANLYGENHVPAIVASNHEAMLMVYAGDTLSWAVNRNALSLTELARRVDIVYGKVSSVWLKKKNQPYTTAEMLARQPLERWKRIKRAVLEQNLHGVALQREQGLPLVVNGQHLPPLRNLLRLVRKMYQPPKRIVYCHGDLTGDNILVDRATDDGWQFIDFDWVGWHDWRVAASFMGYWWWSNHSTVNNASISVEGRRLIIDYSVEESAAAKLVMKRADAFAQRIGERFGEQSTQRDQLRLQGAILLLGDLRFVEERGRMPEHSIALLGKGIELLATFLPK